MELLGFVACAFIGVSLGLIGAGGSILMVPVLVFFFHIPPLMSTTYALFVVGVTSALAAAGKYRRGDVLIGPAFTFSLTSMVVVVGVRHYVIPLIPKNLFSLGHILITYNFLSMIVFAMLMMLAAYFMIRKREHGLYITHSRAQTFLKMFPYTLTVGIITGLLGAGGGFLIIPVMTIILGIDIKKAAGTSLAVVAINSLSGFIDDVSHIAINWEFLVVITLIAFVGSITGVFMTERINSLKLKIAFGWFVFLLGTMIITGQCFSLFKLI